MRLCYEALSKILCLFCQSPNAALLSVLAYSAPHRRRYIGPIVCWRTHIKQVLITLEFMALIGCIGAVGMRDCDADRQSLYVTSTEPFVGHFPWFANQLRVQNSLIFYSAKLNAMLCVGFVQVTTPFPNSLSVLVASIVYVYFWRSYATVYRLSQVFLLNKSWTLTNLGVILFLSS